MRVSTKFAPPREPGLGGRFPLRSKEPELGPKELGLGGSEPPTGVGGLDWLGVRVRVGVGGSGSGSGWGSGWGWG